MERENGFLQEDGDNILGFGRQQEQDLYRYADSMSEFGALPEPEGTPSGASSGSSLSQIREKPFAGESEVLPFFAEGEFCDYPAGALKPEPKKFFPSVLPLGERSPEQPEEFCCGSAGCAGLPGPVTQWQVMKECLLNTNFFTVELGSLGWAVGGMVVVTAFLLIFLQGIFRELWGQETTLLALMVLIPLSPLLIGYYRLAEEKFRRIYPLLAFGNRTQGQITRCVREHGEVFLPGDDRRRARGSFLRVGWRFADDTGRIWEKEVCYPAMKEYFIHGDSRGEVCYNPADPRESLWIGADWRERCFFYEPAP